MIQAVSNLRFEAIERPTEAIEKPQSQAAAGPVTFEMLFEDAAEAAIPKTDVSTATAATASAATASAASASAASASAASASDAAASTASAADTSLGDPDVQGWLDSYWAEAGNASDAHISYQPVAGAPNNYPAGSVIGPDTIYTQALDNQLSTVFSGLTGDNPAEYQSQLPGIPSQQVQQQFDQNLAMENAQRLSLGDAIDTSAYWSDPGPINYEGTTYTSQELGYAGPEQSSGPQPIYISEANQIGTTGTYGVPGYSGTVSGIQPGRYYTLQQLEQAGLQTGQPDTQDHPGSWSTTQSA